MRSEEDPGRAVLSRVDELVGALAVVVGLRLPERARRVLASRLAGECDDDPVAHLDARVVVVPQVGRRDAVPDEDDFRRLRAVGGDRERGEVRPQAEPSRRGGQDGERIRAPQAQPGRHRERLQERDGLTRRGEAGRLEDRGHVRGRPIGTRRARGTPLHRGRRERPDLLENPFPWR